MADASKSEKRALRPFSRAARSEINDFLPIYLPLAVQPNMWPPNRTKIGVILTSDLSSE